MKPDPNIKKAFEKIKTEMTDHLDAINENTSEINSNHTYIQDIEKKIAKLNEKIDDIIIRLNNLDGDYSDFSELKNIHLKPKEVEIFRLLYENMGDLFDYKKIARSLGYTESMVKKEISSMINKGIPVIKKYFEKQTFLVLDPDFRNLQAKNNVVKMKK